MPECAGKSPKPVMKGLLKRQIAKNVGVAFALGVAVAGAFKYFVVDARMKKYADFYRDYDPEEAFKLMVKRGAVFESATSMPSK